MTTSELVHAPPVALTLGDAISDAFVIARRHLIRYQRDPQTLVFLFVQPIMFILLFSYVFGGSIDIPGMDYTSFLVPGIIAQTVTFNNVGTSIAIAEDLQKGIMDRFRSLPMSGFSVIAGRVLTDLLVTTVTVVFMTAVGYLVGFRITTGFVPALAGLGLLVIFGFSFSWIAAFIGIKVNSVEVAQSAGFVWLFPLNFISSVFVVPATMPSALKAFADVNPITLTVDALRGLTVGGPVADPLVGALIWAAVISVVFGFLVVRAWDGLID